MRYHTVGPGVCPICGKRIFKKVKLDRHMQRYSGTAKRQCDVSHKVLSCDLLLASHVLGHADLKFKCDVCGKRLPDKTSLEVCTCTAYVSNASTVHRRLPANCRYSTTRRDAAIEERKRTLTPQGVVSRPPL